MMRWIWFAVCSLLALVLLAWGLLMPMHMRAVETSVIQLAGKKSPDLVAHGLELARDQKLGAAQLISQAASSQNLPGASKIQTSINILASRRPALLVSGGDVSPRMERLFASDPHPVKGGTESLAEFVIRLENREIVLELLHSSANPVVQELLRCRALTNTSIFSPSMSSSGQAFDAAIAIAGLLVEENRLTPHLRDILYTLANNANRGGDTQPLELALLDMMSLGQRFNWGQLVAFAGHVENTETLRVLAEQARNEARLPALFSMVEMSGQPDAVVHYIMNFSATGFNDLAATLRYGSTGINELLKRNERLTPTSPMVSRIATLPVIQPVYDFGLNCARWTPTMALALKWLAYLSAGFFLAAAFHFARPELSDAQLPLQMRVFSMAREVLFALGVLLVVLLLSEPFLAQESQKAALPLRLHLPRVGSIVPAGTTTTPNHPNHMNQNILTLALFFVLQGLLYIASCVKLGEIRRQLAPARIKLKLLENEDHLFDAGLYLGFLGTIVAFMYAFLSKGNLSLIGAYSSTSFGIIFVSLFKIFHLRPTRRKLLLEAESVPAEKTNASAPAASAVATMP